MGIFRNKVQSEPLGQITSADSTAAPNPQPAVSAPAIDGVYPPPQTASPATTTDFMSQTAPVLDNAGASDYIMTDPPEISQSTPSVADPQPVAPVQTAVPVAEPVANAIPQQEHIAEPEPQVTAAEDTSVPVQVNINSTHREDLTSIKNDALKQLSPLVTHLEQTPEEKFNTTMMLLQATDDHSLVKVAYDAAQAITDEKIRARALLDIVNEINYFSQRDGTP